ncbi:MAG: IS607 family transposase [Richelia sp. RM2_1_2]|nr:IS607 family transposase [Richelia sp. RM2_1_2]
MPKVADDSVDLIICDGPCEGKLTPFHTEGGHRRYYRADIEKLAGIYVEPVKVSDGKRVGIYCRVSSHEQKTKGDLERQVGRMTTEALKRGYSIIVVFDEVGSGMNDNRKKLQKLFELVEKKEIDVVLIEHKDRLSRFCINYLISYFKSYQVRVEWADEVSTEIEIDEEPNTIYINPNI